MIIIVVAHPDDEALWFAGGIKWLKELHHNVVILSLSGRANNTRSSEFEGACKFADVTGILGSLPDDGEISWNFDPDFLSGLLNDSKIFPSRNTLVVTHIPYGNEHLHPHHVRTSKLVKEWATSRDYEVGYFLETPIALTENRFSTSISGAYLVQLSPLRFVYRLFRNYLSALARQHLNIRYLIGYIPQMVINSWELASLFRYSTIFRFKIDQEWKIELLAHYQSQIAGLETYSAYWCQHDYLLLRSRAVRGLLKYTKHNLGSRTSFVD